MTPTWDSSEPLEIASLSFAAKARAGTKALLLALLIFSGLSLLLILRLVERPLFGSQRPWTPQLTVIVCLAALWIVGLSRVSHGKPMNAAGAMVANHSSWLDIFALNAAGPLYFVSKSEVAEWPGIGWLARATGTVFIRREKREAGTQKTIFEERLNAGHRLLFFPEGTSTDGQRVLHFKPTLFAALFSDRTPDNLNVQPVTVAYNAPPGVDPRFYGWWGDMEFGPHLLQVLAQPRHGSVEITWHPPISLADAPDRKAMARASEAAVRSVHPHGALLH